MPAAKKLPMADIAGSAGKSRARSHCRYVAPLIRFIPDSLTYSVPLFLKRQCDRTLGKSWFFVGMAVGMQCSHTGLATSVSPIRRKGDAYSHIRTTLMQVNHLQRRTARILFALRRLTPRTTHARQNEMILERVYRILGLHILGGCGRDFTRLGDRFLATPTVRVPYFLGI